MTIRTHLLAFVLDLILITCLCLFYNSGLESYKNIFSFILITISIIFIPANIICIIACNCGDNLKRELFSNRVIKKLKKRGIIYFSYHIATELIFTLGPVYFGWIWLGVFNLIRVILSEIARNYYFDIKKERGIK